MRSSLAGWWDPSGTRWMTERIGITRFRRELVDLLARSVPFTDAPDDETGVPTAVLVVLEWQGDDGNRWLAISSCLGSGQPAPPWTERMLAWEALHWNDTTDDEEDE